MICFTIECSGIIHVTDIVFSKDAEKGTIQMRYLDDRGATMEEGYLEIDGTHCSDCLVTKENAEFDITIEWDDKSESLILMNID